ncbi:TPA: hypothetical protein KJG11_003844 [Escherichia coli]|nr:hypothetical protein [Escherichia coli]
MSDKIAAFEKLAASTSTGYQRSESSQQLAGTMNTLIVVLCRGSVRDCFPEQAEPHHPVFAADGGLAGVQILLAMGATE